MGMVHELVDADELLDRATAVAEQTPEDCLEQYAFTKRAAKPPRCATSPTSPTRSTTSYPTE